MANTYNLTLNTPTTYVSGITYEEIQSSGFVKNSDLVGSGYVRSINGLKNTPTVTGSGSIQVWVDGQTIQIGTTAGGGTPESDQYPVDARAASGNIIPSVSGTYNLGSATKFFHQVWANSGIFQSGVSVSGQDVLYKINGLGGPHININPGYGVEPLVLNDHTIFINVSGDAKYSNLHTSGYIRNSDFIQSGFITKTEVALSGFTTQTELVNSGYVRHADMLVSGYLRHVDLLTSGYVRSIKGLSHTPDIIGSGNIQVWTDGSTIQIGTTAGGGTPESDQYPVDARAVSGHITMNASGYWNYGSVVSPGQTVYANSGVFTSGVYISGLPVPTQSQITTSGYVRHADMLVSGYARLPDLLGSGFKPESQIDHGTITGLLDNDHPQYILNSAFVGSGFITKAEVASSGFATRSELVTSGYVRHADMLVSGYLKHADLLSSGYVRTLNGGSNALTLVGSGNINIWRDGQTVQINATSAGGGLTQQQTMAIGSLKI